jgi:hypothetical protein
MTGHIKVGGVWKEMAAASVKVGGAWKEVTNGYTKVAGAWKEWYAAGGSSYDLLETVTLTSSTASVTFSGLGAYSDYKHLQLRVVAQTVDSDNYSRGARIRINSLTSGYARANLAGNGSSAYSSAETNRLYMEFPDCILGQGTPAIYSPAVFDFLDFAASKTNVVRAMYGFRSPDDTKVYLTSAFNTTAQAMTSFVFSTPVNLTAGSRLSLYGIKGA